MGAARKVQDWTAILVDEDLGTILRVKDALQRHDCVVAVASADTVVAVAEAHKNALVFLAPTSADPQRWAVCTQLRDTSDNHHVICLLDRYDRDDVAAAFAAGADDVLTK